MKPRTHAIVVRPKPGISAEEAKEIRAQAWAHVFRSFKENHARAAGSDGSDDTRRSLDHRKGVSSGPPHNTGGDRL